jgi:crossover junction endodeoxyribonuclease RuvC
MRQPIRIVGIDPGLRATGWGVIESDGARLAFIACGTVTSDAGDHLSARLCQLHNGLSAALGAWSPEEAAVEQTFVNRDAVATLKLGQARGIALLAASEAGLPVVSYAPAAVKRAVVGYGRAEKQQVQQMVKLLLGLAQPPTPHDAADALAVAICHLQASTGGVAEEMRQNNLRPQSQLRSWRQYRP